MYIWRPANRDDLGFGDQGIPGIATGVEDRLISVPDAGAEPVAAQILPDVLCRVQLRRVGWKWQEHDVGWHDETRRTVAAGTVEDQQSDGAEADGLANFSQMLVRASMLTLGMTNAAPGKTYFRSPASFSSALHCAY